MTDTNDTQPGDMERAERIRRLQERRTPPKTPPAAKARTAVPGARPSPRRRHPAAASRFLLAGLSIASFFTVGGAMILANGTPSGAVQAAAQPAGQAATTTGATASPATATKATSHAPVVYAVTRGS
jgi:hypothetical protein